MRQHYRNVDIVSPAFAWTAPSLRPIETTSSTRDELVTRQQDEPELRQTCLLSRCPHSLEQPTSISHLRSDHQPWSVQVASKNWTLQPGFPTLTCDHPALAILHFVTDLTCDINRVIIIIIIIIIVLLSKWYVGWRWRMRLESYSFIENVQRVPSHVNWEMF